MILGAGKLIWRVDEDGWNEAGNRWNGMEGGGLRLGRGQYWQQWQCHYLLAHHHLTFSRVSRSGNGSMTIWAQLLEGNYRGGDK